MLRERGSAPKRQCARLADECEPPEDAEPSLGSPDRAIDQTRWCVGSKDDLERDECDREDDDPDEEKQQPLEMTPCA